MNRFGWFVLNVTLVAALCGVGLLLGESNPSAHWRKVEDEILAAAKPSQAVQTDVAEPEPVVSSRVERYPMDSKTADVLWQHTLFNPDRTEDIAIKAEADAAKEAKTPEYAFEVRGIMMINKERVVSLSVKPQGRPPVAPRVLRSRRPGLAGRPATPKAAPEKPKRTTHVYREGDAVEDTGYVVGEITMETVTLKRGDEELVLEVDLNDEMSKQRRDSAAAAEAVKVVPAAPVAAKAPAKTTTTKAGSPPPPPPAPGALMASPSAPGSTGGNAVLEERLKRIREKQQELLKKNQNRRTTK